MGLIGLREDALKLILFGVKGGVGKTTCASSAGLYLANNNKNTLLISTDPAHSLSDSLGQKIGDEIHPVRCLPRPAESPVIYHGDECCKSGGAPMPRVLTRGRGLLSNGVKQIEGVDKLSAIEISAEKALSRFRIEYEDELRRLLDTGTYLDGEDIDSILALPIPGIDEVMGFKTIVDFIEEGKFDKYIVDTAPTGHALRLLTFPELLDDWIKVMAKMRWKYRYMVTSFAGKYKPDSADDFLMSMKKTVKKIEGLLRGQSRCEFIIVTIPEDMAVKETERMIKSLDQYGMKVKQMVINHVIPEQVGCPFCQARREEQDKYIGQIREKFSDLKITIVLLQPHEIKGIDVLKNIGSMVFAA